jgi:Tfp pilus assembly protein PilO
MTSAELIARLKKQPIGFACGLICLLCIGWLYFRGGASEQRQADYEAARTKATLMSSNVAISKNLPEQVAELQTVTKEIDARLMKASQLAVNQQYFYRLEAETEVKLLDVRPSPLPRNAKTIYVGVPYTVNVQGTYKNVMAFLQRLEKGRHFCRINNATFSKSAVASEGSLQSSTPGISLTLSLEMLGQP